MDDDDIDFPDDVEVEERRQRETEKERLNKSPKEACSDDPRTPPEEGEPNQPQLKEQARIVRKTLPVVQSETLRLYRSHLARELTKRKLPVPDCLKTSIESVSVKILAEIGKIFVSTELREWLTEQSDRLDIESLTMVNYKTLLKDLFLANGTKSDVIIDRVMLVFFFSSDIIIRIYEEFPAYRRNELVIRYYEWSCQFMSKELSPIIDREGGWRHVLFLPDPPKESQVLSTRGLAVTVFCVAAIAVYIYARYRKSQ